MYNVEVDPHTHTIFSLHAYGTIEENVNRARLHGMKGIAITDHLSPIFGGEEGMLGSLGTFVNTSAFPSVCDGVRVFRGVEVDILDTAGNLAGWDTRLPFRMESTVAQAVLRDKEVIIGSVHFFRNTEPRSILENTQLYCNAITRNKIHILGHVGRSGLEFEIDTVLTLAKQQGTLIEINEHSIDSGPEVQDKCKKIALRCAELEVPIVIGSDAHSSYMVGLMPRVQKMLEEISFPRELVMNRTLQTFCNAIHIEG